MAENEVYEVEEILDQREVEGQLQFFVKWKSFNEDWNTWEPVDNLLDCFDLVLEFQEKEHDNAKKDTEKSKLARKEALKIVKKAKKLNSGGDNIKKALQKHAAIVKNQDVSLNLSVDTSIPTFTPSKSPKSPKHSPSSSPKSKKLGEGIGITPTKRTPKKPSKLEEYFDPSKMFVKSSTKILSNGVNRSKVNSPSVLRTLLTTGLPVSQATKQTKINSPNIQSSSKLKSCTISQNNCSKSLDDLQSGIEVKKNTSKKSNCSQNSTECRKINKKKSDGAQGGSKKTNLKDGIKNKTTNLNKNLKKPSGVKALKTSDKNLKMKKTGNLMLVKMKPVIKKEKMDNLTASGQSESSGEDVKDTKSQVINVSSVQEKVHTDIHTSQGEKKVVKKKQMSVKIKKISHKNVKKKGKTKIKTENQTGGKKIKKQKTDAEKKVKVKKKSTEALKKEIKEKGIKRKLEDCIEIIDTESDDDIEVRYSVSPKSKKAKTDNSPKRAENVKKIEVPSKIEKELSKKTLQVKVRPMESSASCKKMRLIDTVKPNPGVSKSAIVRPVSPTPVFTSVKPIMSAAHARPIVPMETLCADVPGYHYVPAMIPISPSSMSYKMLLDSLPFQYHTKKSNKKREDDMMREDDVERRMSVRQSECAYRYKEIIVKKCNRYTQIWLNTHTKLKNSLNPQVIQEVVSALNSAKYDDSNLVMFSGLGNVFCSGIDLTYLISMDRKMAARKMVDALRDFMKALITFPKPLIAVVTGSAIGLGMTMLPLCDIVYASDKASFHLPYSQLSQTPEGCASFLLPTTVGMAMANELLIGGRKITAIEACQLGLVSQVFWPTSIMQEVIPRIENMALQSGKALETTKLLIRSHQRTKIELTNESECNLLLERWPSMECQKAIQNYLNNDNNFCI